MKLLEKWSLKLKPPDEVWSPLTDNLTEPISTEKLAEIDELQNEGEPDLLVELINLFLEEAPVRIKDLRRTVSEGNIPSIERGAHALKGGAGHFGAVPLASIRPTHR